jgi:hypothetical protein
VLSPNVQALADGGQYLTNHHTYKFCRSRGHGRPGTPACAPGQPTMAFPTLPCSPTRASLLTSRIPGHGIWDTNPGLTAPLGLNGNISLVSLHCHQSGCGCCLRPLCGSQLPAQLKKAGYRAYHVGKWHLVFARPCSAALPARPTATPHCIPLDVYSAAHACALFSPRSRRASTRPNTPPTAVALIRAWASWAAARHARHCGLARGRIVPHWLRLVASKGPLQPMWSLRQFHPCA